MSPAELTAAAQRVIDSEETVIAAGIFSMQDSVAALTKGSIAGSLADPFESNPILSGVGSIAGMEVARQQHAHAEGLTERMTIAVTERRIHILAMPVLGGAPERELLRFDRDQVEVKISRLGLSRLLKLTDAESGIKIKLIGTTVGRGEKAAGDKAVLVALA